MPESNPRPSWLTLSEAIDVLGVHETTLRRWADKGAIKTVRTPGGQRRFLQEDVERIAREGYSAEAGHAVPRLLAAVALAFIVAAGLPAHAGATLLVAVFVGWLCYGLFGAEVSTWGTPAGARHLEQPGRRDRTADR